MKILKQKYIALFLGMFFFVCVAHAGAPRQTINKDNVKLSWIIGNKHYNLKEPIELVGNAQNKFIKKHEDDYIPSVCLAAFVKWCNKFVGSKRDYVIINSPADKIDSENLPDEVEINPFAKSDTLNVFFEDNNVVIKISGNNKLFLDTYVITLNAVIPFQGKLYKCERSYCFNLQLNFKKFKTKNVADIATWMGNFIVDHPSYFFDIDGCLNYFPISQFVKWTIAPKHSAIIQEMGLNPATDIITIASVYQ